MRWYSYDPFAHVAEGAGTVGALRAKAAGHDVADPVLRQGPLRAPARASTSASSPSRPPPDADPGRSRWVANGAIRVQRLS